VSSGSIAILAPGPADWDYACTHGRIPPCFLGAVFRRARLNPRSRRVRPPRGSLAGVEFGASTPDLHGLPRAPRSPSGNGDSPSPPTTGARPLSPPYETQMPLCTQSQWAALRTQSHRKRLVRSAAYGIRHFGPRSCYPTSVTARSLSSIGSAESARCTWPHRFRIDQARTSGHPHSPICGPHTAQRVQWRGVLCKTGTCCHPPDDMIAVTFHGASPWSFGSPASRPG